MRSTTITSLVGLAVAMAFSGAALAAQATQTSPTFGTVTSQQAQATASQQGSVFGQSVRTRALTNRRHHLLSQHLRHSQHHLSNHLRHSRHLSSHVRHSHHLSSHMRHGQHLSHTTTGIRHGATGTITTPNGNTITLPGSNTTGHGAIVHHLHGHHAAHHARHTLQHTHTHTRHAASSLQQRTTSGTTGMTAPVPGTTSSLPPGTGMSRTPGMTGSGTAIPGYGNGAAGTITTPNGNIVTLPGSNVNGGATVNGQATAPGVGGMSAPYGGGASGSIYTPGGNTVTLPGGSAQMQGGGMAGGMGGSAGGGANAAASGGPGGIGGGAGAGGGGHR